MIKSITISTTGQGLYEFTGAVAEVIRESGADTGLCTLFVRHTSASILVQENADPSVSLDLQNWLKRQVPEGDPLYTHTMEGPDDMPAHIKSMLTQTSISIPVLSGRLALGTWQGVFLFEHRHGRHEREILLHVASDATPD